MITVRRRYPDLVAGFSWAVPEEFNFGAHYRSGAGEMFFGGPQGFNAFVPESLHQGARSPRLALTGLLKLNVPVSGEVPVSQREEVRLDHRDLMITFEFAALDYAAPELNRYAYMLEGFDTRWMDLGPFRRVTYTNLDAGRYVLRVKAWNADGVASDADFGRSAEGSISVQSVAACSATLRCRVASATSAARRASEALRVSRAASR